MICLVPISISGVRIQPVKCPPNRPIHSVIHCANIELTYDRRWLFYSQVFSYLAEFSIVCRLFVFGVPNANYKLRWLANRNRECNTAFKVHCGRITGSVCASEIFKAQVIITLWRYLAFTVNTWKETINSVVDREKRPAFTKSRDNWPQLLIFLSVTVWLSFVNTHS